MLPFGHTPLHRELLTPGYCVILSSGFDAVAKPIGSASVQIRRRRQFAISLVLVPVVLVARSAAADDAQPAKPARPADAVAKAGSTGEWHWPKVVISKKTTYFTEPLRPDGGVDYVAAFNRRYSQGVTPENNAAVALWRAAGPWEIDETDRPMHFKMLGIPDLALGDDDLAVPLGDERGVLEFMEQTAKKPEFQGRKEENAKTSAALAVIRFQFEAAPNAPWSRQEYPVLAAILKRKEKPLGILAEGLRRPTFYDPLVARPGIPQLFWLSGDTNHDPWRTAGDWFMALRHAADQRGETVRRMERCLVGLPFGTAGVAAAAVLRLVLLGHTTGSNGKRCRCDLESAPGLDRRRGAEFQRQLRGLPPMRPAREICDQSERCTWIDWMMFLSNFSGVGEGPDGFSVLDRMTETHHGWLAWIDMTYDPKKRAFVYGPNQIEREEAFGRLAQERDMDWTELLRQHNRCYDRAVAAFDCVTHRKAIAVWQALEKEAKDQANRTAELVVSDKPAALAGWGPKVKAQRMAELAAATEVPFVRLHAEIEQDGLARDRMTLVALALAGYRANHRDQYPKALADLVAAYIDAIPQDPFADGPLIYRPEEHRSARDGYVLYSVGPNGEDDGGGVGEPETGAARWRDDIAIRTPPKKSPTNE